MTKLKDMDKDAHDWLQQMPPNTWSRAFLALSLCVTSCSTIVVKCLISTFLKIENNEFWACCKQSNANSWLGTIKSRKKLRTSMVPSTRRLERRWLKNAEYSNTCYALPSGNSIFQVQSRDVVYIVDIVGRQCKCRRWDLLGYLAPMPFLAWDMKIYLQNQLSIHAIQLRHLLVHIAGTFGHAKTYHSGNMFLDRRLDFSVWEKGGQAPKSRKKHATEVQYCRENMDRG